VRADVIMAHPKVVTTSRISNTFFADICQGLR